LQKTVARMLRATALFSYIATTSHCSLG